MVVLVDNGQSYGDRRLYFVTVTTRALVQRILDTTRPFGSTDPEDQTHTQRGARIVGLVGGPVAFDEDATKANWSYRSWTLDQFKEAAEEYL